MKFKHVPVYEIGDPLDLSRIEEYERKLNKPLPEDYRAFLLEYNGGGLSENNDELFINEENSGGLAWMLGIEREDEEEYNIEKHREPFQKLPVPYSHLLPFGVDHSGGLMCISLSEEDYGLVYFWNPEYGSEETLDDALVFCTESFREFMENLVMDED